MFDDRYKHTLRREFRRLSIPKRQMLFETTTQRILLHLDQSTDSSSTDPQRSQYPFEIHCFLPWKGSLLSICNQFYCHCLKIPYQMLESHHKSIWKSSQTSMMSPHSCLIPSTILNTTSSLPTDKVDELYQCYLPTIIDSFNVLPVDASSYIQDESPCLQSDIKTIYQHNYANPSNSKIDQMTGYPKLKTHRNPLGTTKLQHKKRRKTTTSRACRATASRDEYRRREFEKYMRDKKRKESAKSNQSRHVQQGRYATSSHGNAFSIYKPTKKPLTARSIPKTAQKSKKAKLSAETEEQEAEETEEEEPKLLLGFLRYGNNQNGNEDNTKRNKKSSEVKGHREKKEDEMAPLNRFLKNIRSISDRVAGITNEFHDREVEEYESMRDTLYLQKIMSEADVDPTDQNVDEPKHWKKVETMFEVMDHKESSNRGKQHIERALQSLHCPDLRELLKQVRESLALLHNSIDNISMEPSSGYGSGSGGSARRSVTFSDLPIPEDEIKALLELDQFISPALKQQHLTAPNGPNAKQQRNRSSMQKNFKSKASMLIEAKDDVLKSLEQTINLRNNAADAGKQILSTLRETAADHQIDHHQSNEAAQEPLIGVSHRAEVIYDSHPPDNMATRSEERSARRESLMNVGILEDDMSDSAVQPEKFVEDMLLTKIEDLTEECQKWKSRYNELTSQHRRMSVQHGEVVKALKNSDVLKGNERLSSLTDQHEQQTTMKSAVCTNDAAVQTLRIAIEPDSNENHKKTKHGIRSLVDRVAHVDRDLEMEEEDAMDDGDDDDDEDIIVIPDEETGIHVGGLTVSYQSNARRFSVTADMNAISEMGDDGETEGSGLSQFKLDAFAGALGALKVLRMEKMKKTTTKTLTTKFGKRRQTMFSRN